MQFREIASGLRFPEGPLALDDGSVLVVEIAAERLTRVGSDGSVTVGSTRSSTSDRKQLAVYGSCMPSMPRP